MTKIHENYRIKKFKKEKKPIYSKFLSVMPRGRQKGGRRPGEDA